MLARIKKVGDLNSDMWRRKVSLGSRFERLRLDPPASS
jgi:hypothetical protein